MINYLVERACGKGLKDMIPYDHEGSHTSKAIKGEVMCRGRGLCTCFHQFIKIKRMSRG